MGDIGEPRRQIEAPEPVPHREPVPATEPAPVPDLEPAEPEKVPA